jgi:CBS domain-containing membrane protein
MPKQIPAWIKILGVDVSNISHKERLISSLGAFIGIGGILLVTTHYVHSGHAALLVASMGASAVLLFVVPHGTLSQPWPLLGGHVVSASIGVTIAGLVSNEVLAAAMAVGVAVGAMHYLRCIHPPGGATAVSAVIGGVEVYELGYQYVLTPVLLNAVIILLIAILFNYVFEWRRYPAYLQELDRKEANGRADDEVGEISHEDFVFALSEMDSFIDVSEDDLMRIYHLATGASDRRHLKPEQLQLGHYYSNGKYGDEWSVRLIVDESEDLHDNRLIYKVVAGRGRRTSGVLDRDAFACWARYEVYRDEENWRRLNHENA